MAYIQQRGERKYKITVCNGYKPNGQKRMQARTISVPKEVPKRGIRQYVMAEAERLEKRFRTGIDQSENSRFEDYANGWLTRMERRYKASTLEGYDSLTQRFETAKQRLETVMAELDRMQTQRADIEAFLESFEALPDTLTEFKLENWHSLVDYATVYSADDIRFTFKHGQEVQA